jgi:hypothetical protein
VTSIDSSGEALKIAASNVTLNGFDPRAPRGSTRMCSRRCASSAPRAASST